ncbi:MAG: deoxyribonuclease IV [Bacilli bacterium]|nr:deoxyribonuclease IV [Bacilli bacterium]
MKLIIGSHVSFKKEEQLLGSLKEALSYKANTFMLYTGAPQNTNRQPINKELTLKAQSLMKENNIDINNLVVHAPYIINLANEKNLDFSIRFLKEELKRCEELGIYKLVLHPGSHVGLGLEKGIENIVFALNQVKDSKVKICLETMAGKGSEIGTIEELQTIIDKSENKNLLICIDTCHLNDAGYDLNDFNNILNKIDNLIGIDKIGCVHVNDSKNVISAHKDRHANIGFGTISFNTLINIIYNEKLASVPKILETPYVDVYPPYKYEIEMIRNKKFNENLLNDIINQK